MTDQPKNIYESIDRLIALEQRKHELLRELKRALRLADLLGVKPKAIKGKMRHHWVEGVSTFRPWLGAKFIVQIEGEEKRTFDYKQVHEDLWPEKMLALYAKHIKPRRN